MTAAAEDGEYILSASGRRKLLLDTAMVLPKAARDTQGIQVMALKKNQTVESVAPFNGENLSNPQRFRPKSLPSAGALAHDEEEDTQLSL